MNTPMGEQKGSIQFNQEEGEPLKGIFKSIVGVNEFTDGTLDGEDFVFSFKANTQMGVSTFDVKGTLEGDNISGVIKTQLGAFAFKGKREE
jgi:aminopeptidase-like protein